MMRLIILLSFIILSFSINCQEKLENGIYLSSDKLKYITIKDHFQFKYTAYKGYSPYTIKEKRKNETKRMCGTIGYILEENGKGTYSIKNGEIVLKFEIDYSTIATKKIDTRLLKGISFKILELEKLEN
ncbi:hypothetical protein Q2T40_10260 [Winogradskyella maritima]|uniref:NlpE-like protein n=1 Tax=Winogradskyella maritima TaxID=1517766 RepID=A0ABV8AK19_9FLAO|nr:hypothetical protein [Winogradskyella maritima]